MFWLIGINVFVYTIVSIATRIYGPYFYMYIRDRLCMRPDTVLLGWVWTFVTYMFMHGSITHLLVNMLGLFIFGAHIERQMGSFEFLLYYLVTGILAGVFSFGAYLPAYLNSLNSGQPHVVILLGASGAIFAVQLAYAVFFPDSIIYLWGILPLRAPVMVLGYTALEVILQITGSNSGVAHLTHLAGFGFGWLYILVRFNINPWRRLTRRY